MCVFLWFFSVRCQYSRIHVDKRIVCKCRFDLFSGVCIKNGCIKSVRGIADRGSCFADMIEVDITDNINDLVRDMAKNKTHKFDKSIDKSFIEHPDKDEMEDECYIYTRRSFTDGETWSKTNPRSGLADPRGGSTPNSRMDSTINNIKEIRQEPRRVCNKCKNYKLVTNFDLKK